VHGFGAQEGMEKWMIEEKQKEHKNKEIRVSKALVCEQEKKRERRREG
jgi:hypothetical protein